MTNRTVINFIEKTIQTKSTAGNSKKEKLAKDLKLNCPFSILYLNSNKEDYFLAENFEKEEYEIWNYFFQELKSLEITK